MVKFIQNGEEIGTVKFPITEVGTSTTISFTIENVLENNIELIFFSEDDDLVIGEYPQRLSPQETAQAQLIFSPKQDRPVPLQASWGFREIIG